MENKNDFPMMTKPQVREERKITIDLHDLALAMKLADDPEDDGGLASARAAEVEKILNRYIKDAQTVAVNGVNLYGVDSVSVDAYDFHESDDERYYTVGLSFLSFQTLQAGGRIGDEKALWFVDAMDDCLIVTISMSGKLVCIDRK